MFKELLLALGLGGGASSELLFEESFSSPDFDKAWRMEGAGAVYDPAEKAMKFTSLKPGADYMIYKLDDKKFRGKRV